MSRLQLALNVGDLDEAVSFYSTLFGTEPAKRYPGYANFSIEEPPLKLVLFSDAGPAGTINHLGVEVDSTEEVQEAIKRLGEAKMTLDIEEHVDCCYAVQDKVWVSSPEGSRWETYVVLEHSEGATGETGGCCANETTPVTLSSTSR